MASELDKFFDGLKNDGVKDESIFSPVPEEGQVEKPKEDDVDPETVPESIKDRRHRRLEQKLQAERESNIRLNERIKTLSELENRTPSSTTLDDYDKDFLRMYGDTPEGRAAAEINKNALLRLKEEAKKEVLDSIERRQADQEAQEKEYESFIDTNLESLEDAYGIDMTSNAPSARKTRREFLELVEKLSPKDSDGSITDYADFGAVFEQYQPQIEKPDNSKQKELASRSMVRSGNASATPKAPTPGWDGWRQDAGL